MTTAVRRHAGTDDSDEPEDTDEPADDELAPLGTDDGG